MEDNHIPYPFDWSPDHQAYHYGDGINGIGIYLDDGKWWGNTVVDCDVIIAYGPYDTLEIAKVEMTKEYIKRQADCFS